MSVQQVPSTQTRISDSEWTIECGEPACRTVLADVAWVDIDHNMAANRSEATGSPLLLDRLRPAHLRRYRMCVMLPFRWQFDQAKQSWSAEGPRSDRASKARTDMRVVRGAWNSELGQLGSPPFVLVCAACGTRQTVAPQRRTGTPDFALLTQDG